MKVLENPRVGFKQDHTCGLLTHEVSPSFEGVDEGDRQERLVLNQVFKTLNEFEQERIEFIFTEAPLEVAFHSTGTNGADSSEPGKG